MGIAHADAAVFGGGAGADRPGERPGRRIPDARAADLHTGQRLAFAQIPFAAPGQAGDGIPTGKAVGTDVIQGTAEQLYPELVLDTSRPYAGTKKGDWPVFKGLVGYPGSATGCFGFQIDGSHFTEVVVVTA